MRRKKSLYNANDYIQFRNCSCLFFQIKSKAKYLQKGREKTGDTFGKSQETLSCRHWAKCFTKSDCLAFESRDNPKQIQRATDVTSIEIKMAYA